jgi:hypothetical protein
MSVVVCEQLSPVMGNQAILTSAVKNKSYYNSQTPEAKTLFQYEYAKYVEYFLNRKHDMQNVYVMIEYVK